MYRYRLAAAAVLAALTLAGCTASKDASQATAPTGRSTPGDAAATPAPAADSAKPDEVAAERAKLSPADRALVDAQEWCVVSDDERLGSMGPPLKLDIKSKPVFVCCKGCKRKAEADPDATLAKAEQLKAKARK